MGHGASCTEAVVSADSQLTELFEAYRDRLVGTAYFVLGSHEDARDAVQEGFVKCWRRKEQAAEIANLRAWIFTVVLNSARDLRRRRRIRRADTLPTEDVMPAPVSQTDPTMGAERREAVARVREALHLLPETEREVFLLRQNGDLPFTGVAEALGIPVGTAKTRMRAALRRLRTALGTSTGPNARSLA
jgi:RNA polymerase sigma-70 factor (ECF subfamily)